MIPPPRKVYDYYSTRYFIWANDAAKAALGNDFTGEGPDVSSCFLMNELFEQCGWEGNAYMQATDEIRKEIPVLNNVGRYVQKDGELTETLDEVGQQALNTFKSLEYYYGTNFEY